MECGRASCAGDCRMCRTARGVRVVRSRATATAPSWYVPPRATPGPALPDMSIDTAFAMTMKALGSVSTICEDYHRHNRRKTDAQTNRHLGRHHTSPEIPQDLVFDVPPGTYDVVVKDRATGRTQTMRVAVGAGEDVDIPISAPKAHGQRHPQHRHHHCS